MNNTALTQFFSKAEADRKIKSALQFLKDLSNINNNNGYAFINQAFFAEKYHVSKKTIYRWRNVLIKHGYIELKNSSVVLINYGLGADETSQNSAKISPNKAENGAKKMDTFVRPVDISEKNVDKVVLLKQKKTKYKQNHGGNPADNPVNSDHVKTLAGLGKLPTNQFLVLLKNYGQEVVERAVSEMTRYCAKTGKHYTNLYSAIGAWIKRDFNYAHGQTPNLAPSTTKLVPTYEECMRRSQTPEYKAQSDAIFAEHGVRF